MGAERGLNAADTCHRRRSGGHERPQEGAVLRGVRGRGGRLRGAGAGRCQGQVAKSSHTGHNDAGHRRAGGAEADARCRQPPAHPDAYGQGRPLRPGEGAAVGRRRLRGEALLLRRAAGAGAGPTAPAPVRAPGRAALRGPQPGQRHPPGAQGRPGDRPHQHRVRPAHTSSWRTPAVSSPRSS